MGLIIQQRALQAAGGLRQVLPVVRKRDKLLFDQIHRAMNSVVLNIAEADAYGYFPRSRVTEVDIALDEVCAMSWRLSGRQSRRPRHHVMAHTSSSFPSRWVAM